jgi:hypothetical protein
MKVKQQKVERVFKREVPVECMYDAWALLRSEGSARLCDGLATRRPGEEAGMMNRADKNTTVAMLSTARVDAMSALS